MPGSKLDHVYRRILMTRFFTKGWGKPDNLKRLFAFRKVVSKRETCFKLVPKDYPVSIVKEETQSDCKILQGKFTSPFVHHLPGLLPKESETAHFQAIFPNKWSSEHYKPVCLHLAGTGDHGFWRRRQTMVKPLIKSAGIGGLLLENPFYGLRKPKDQIRSSLHNVTDIFVMGGCLILESLALFHWCERSGLGPLGISGLSMGGHMASLAATNWPKPLVLVPCLSWSTASSVFTEGVMSDSINWDLLQSQYFADVALCDEIQQIIFKEEDAFRAGQHFAKFYPFSMNRVEQLDKQRKKAITFYSNPSELLPSKKGKDISVKESNLLPPKQGMDMSVKESNISKNVDFIPAGISPQASKVQATMQQNTNGETHYSASTKCSDAEKEKRAETGGTSEMREFPLNLNEQYASQNVTQKLSVNTILEKLSLLTSIDLLKTKTKADTEKPPSCSLTKHKEREAYQFMRGIMDECTHLKNFDVPVDTSLIIAVCAKDDAYVPRESSTPLNEIWPGAEIKMLNAGHVSAYVLYQKTFRNAIVESFERLRKKYNWDETKGRCM